MFTGIVEEIGRLQSRNDHRFTFAAHEVLKDVGVDDSIAVSGVCLTVVEIDANSFSVDVIDETLSRTTLGSLQTSDGVNLERAVRASDRLDGHIVQGHVDATGEVVEAGATMRIRLPEHLCKYVANKGSVSVDGVSLTVVDALDDGFTVALIPHTLAVTTLGNRKPLDRVNVEVDVLARYAERIINFAGSR